MWLAAWVDGGQDADAAGRNVQDHEDRGGQIPGKPPRMLFGGVVAPDEPPMTMMSRLSMSGPLTVGA